jgi:hypothetical protein
MLAVCFCGAGDPDGMRVCVRVCTDERSRAGGGGRCQQRQCPHSGADGGAAGWPPRQQHGPARARVHVRAEVALVLALAEFSNSGRGPRLGRLKTGMRVRVALPATAVGPLAARLVSQTYVGVDRVVEVPLAHKPTVAFVRPVPHPRVASIEDSPPFYLHWREQLWTLPADLVPTFDLASPASSDGPNEDDHHAPPQRARALATDALVPTTSPPVPGSRRVPIKRPLDDVASHPPPAKLARMPATVPPQSAGRAVLRPPPVAAADIRPMLRPPPPLPVVAATAAAHVPVYAAAPAPTVTRMPDPTPALPAARRRPPFVPTPSASMAAHVFEMRLLQIE